MKKKTVKRTDKENFYLTNDQLFDEWVKWRDSAKRVEDRIISDKLALQVQEIATKLTFHRCFIHYNNELKHDLAMDAMVKVFKNLKNLKEDRRDSFFNYITRTCWCSFYTTLGKHYKNLNLKKKLLLDAIDLSQQYDSTLAEQLRKQLDDIEKAGNEEGNEGEDTDGY